MLTKSSRAWKLRFKSAVLPPMIGQLPGLAVTSDLKPRLPPNFAKEAVEKHLASYGTIVECKLMDGFGFVEFLNIEDAQDVVETFSRRSFLGEHIVMEFAKPPRRHDQRPSVSPHSVRHSPVDIGSWSVHSQPRHCIWVFNLSQWTRWQDLKDFGRTAGFSVLYSDIDTLDPTLGFIEYPSSEDATAAAGRLDKTELRGNIVRVYTQQENRYHAAKLSRSRSRSPARHNDLCEEMSRMQCDDHEKDEWETQRESDRGAYDENSPWWMYDPTGYH